MQKITMQTIKDRSNVIVECCREQKYLNLYDKVMETYNYGHAMQVLENWNSLDNDPVICAQMAIDLFEHCAENESTIGKIRSAANVVCEAVKKSRDGKGLNYYIKHRLARFKTKLSTKFKTRLNKGINSTSNAASAITDKIQSAVASKAGGAVKANPKISIGGGISSKATTESMYDSIINAYTHIQEVAETMAVCDTIINNQNKMSRRFNLEKIVSESADLENCVMSICECIDTYNMDVRYKYNLALQNIPYSMYKAGVSVNLSEIAAYATDYFLFTNKTPDIDTMQSVLEHNHSFMYSTKDLEGVSYMFKDVAKLKDVKFDDTMQLIHEVDGTKLVNSLKKSKDKIKDMLNNFKKAADKTPAKLKEIIIKSYAQSADDIITEYPDILGIIRILVLTASLGSINPILALVGICTDCAIKLTLSRPQLDKYIKKHKKEIEKVDKKIKDAKSEEDKEKLKKLKKTLESELDKLKDHRDKLYTEKEAEAIRDKESEEELSASMDGDDDFDFGDDFDFDDINFDEAAKFIDRCASVADRAAGMNPDTLIEGLFKAPSLTKDKNTTDGVTNYFANFLTDDNVVDYWNKYISKVIEPLGSYVSENRSIDGICRYMLLDAYAAAQRKTPYVAPEYKDPVHILEHAENTVNGYYTVLDTITNTVVHEGVKETLQLAGINLKNAIRGLSDKDKEISRSIDASFNTFARSAERAIANDNREAVIRGSIIPSASKCIKTAIVAGVGWAISPALAVIGVLGFIGCSKMLQAKERQLVLDEIEIELKMTEKYLRIAEENNDMKATKQLLKVQRDLQRQQQRVKYKMKVYHNQSDGVIPKGHKAAGSDDFDD